MRRELGRKWWGAAVIASIGLSFLSPITGLAPILTLAIIEYGTGGAFRWLLTPLGMRDPRTGAKWAWHELRPLDEMAALWTSR